MKFLFQPTYPYKLSQRFGENKACVDTRTLTKFVSCDGKNPPAGYRSLYASLKGHNGLDTDAWRWQPVYSPCVGLVTEVSTERERGLGVGITTKEPHYCNETGRAELFKVRLWHFMATEVSVGDNVQTGDLIGYAGDTGFATGVHVHMELKPVKNDGGVWENVLQTNGYGGAVDPTEYLFDVFAGKVPPMLKQLTEAAARLLGLVSDRLRS